MGKGNRNSRQRIEEQSANEEKFIARENAKKSKRKKDKLVATACIVVALLIVAVLVLNVLNDTGVFTRTRDAMYVDDVKVNGSMMTYFINDAYESAVNSFYENYYYYILLGHIKVDFSQSLATQTISSTDAGYIGDKSLAGKTWYDYFMDTAMRNAISNVEMYVTYANAGKNIAECALDDEQKAEIEKTLKNLKKSLKDNGMSVSDQYGRGVSINDIRACYELMYRASNYAEYINDVKDAEYKDKSETLLNYVNDNKKDFISAEFLSYTISVSEKTKGSQEAFDKAVEEAKAAAAEIAKATNPTQFAEFVLDYEASLKETGTTKETETKTENNETESSVEETTEEETEIQDVIDDLTETKYYETDDEVGKWMFESASVNDCYVDYETSTETVTVTEKATEKNTETGDESSTSEETTTEKSNVIEYEKFSVTVYMLTKAPDKDNAMTHNLTYLISDNKEAAEKFMAAFLALTEKTGENFEEIAEKYYNELHGIDEDGEHNHGEDGAEPIFSYSRVERVKEKYFADDYNAINDWIDNADRKAGDYTDKLIEIKVESGSGDNKTETTYYVAVLFEAHDLEAWHADALAGVVAEDIDKWYKEAKKSVIHDDDFIYSLVSNNG